MGAKTSPEMLKARKLMEAGATPAEAARKAGVTAQAIYISPWYRDRRQVQREVNETFFTPP